MQSFIEITFPVLKKGKPDTYRTFADYQELGGTCCFILSETKRDLRLKHHLITEGCNIEDMKTGKKYLCENIVFSPFTVAKYPIMQVRSIS